MEKLRTWGAAVRKQRIAQGIRASDLSHRLNISHPTLRRLEQGEPTVGAGVYLAAMHVLGFLDQSTPPLAKEWFHMTTSSTRARVHLANDEDDEYF
ncbi:MAG: helix-turn-helix domain-containing protein [Pseudomonadota bacterium]